ncbi:MAG TPA: RNA polymerase sigma factor [Mobilitalea sp.]|nr:RNA polymerase sigma factor [Mobilitalea sp.]
MHEDHELMELVKQGDKSAYEILVHRYRKAGTASAYSIIRDEYLAEDIVQDCFVQIYILREQYRSIYKFKTYLFALIRNRSIDYYRREKHSQNIENIDPNLLCSAESIEETIIERESIRHIYEQLEQLKGDYKQILYLYAVEDLSYEQISKVMRQSKAQVKIKLYRARQKLKLLREGGKCIEK